MQKEKNNNVTIIGRLVEDFTFDHNFGNTNFYTAKVAVKRNSGIEDVILIMIYESLILQGMKDSYIKLKGEYRSFNQETEDGKSYLRLFMFVKDIDYYQNPNYVNNIKLTGYICQEPILRKTPSGITITDLLLAVNRECIYKSDYIPCIAWENLAIYMSNLKVGDEIKIRGRIQSREYIKKYEDHEEVKTAYEVSINEIL